MRVSAAAPEIPVVAAVEMRLAPNDMKSAPCAWSAAVAEALDASVRDAYLRIWRVTRRTDEDRDDV